MTSEIFQMIAMRERAGNPSSFEITTCLSTIATRLREDTTHRIVSNKGAILEYLAETKQHAEQSGHGLSRPMLTVNFLNDAMLPLCMSLAKRSLLEGSMPAFRFAVDFAVGIAGILGRVKVSEFDIAGDADNIAVRLLSEKTRALKQNKSISDETDQYLALRSEMNKVGKQLIEDPTGFRLVDSHVVKLESDARIDTRQAREYVLAGAKLARDLYKELYQMTKDLYPSIS